METEEESLPKFTPAAQRTALRQDAPIRTRKRKGGQAHNPFDLPPEMIPPGSSYEWKTHTIYGKNDPTYDISLREQGWLPVESSKHPELVPEGHNGPIIRGGLMLMERPIELTQEAQAEDRRNARAAVAAKEEQMHGAPSGTAPRTRPQISRSYEKFDPGTIPIDD